jgi:hypothetical protein
MVLQPHTSTAKVRHEQRFSPSIYSSVEYICIQNSRYRERYVGSCRSEVRTSQQKVREQSEERMPNACISTAHVPQVRLVAVQLRHLLRQRAYTRIEAT